MDLLSIITTAVGAFLLVDAFNAGRSRRDRPPRPAELVLPSLIAGLLILVWIAWTAMASLADLARTNGS